jgi:heme oxygenase (mycobilin-producing)
VLVVSRFVVDEAGDFVERARAALAALAACPGYVGGRLARAYDEPAHWSIVTEWASVGAYRRALSTYDVRVHATPLLAQSLDEPSAYEVLADVAPGGAVTVATSDRA